MGKLTIFEGVVLIAALIGLVVYFYKKSKNDEKNRWENFKNLQETAEEPKKEHEGVRLLE